ncbi:MAG: hypothetical protein M1837_006400 [Sclerophora amabilis]|nr:MAG: hypothetical protein M1837_006400 [Sclerophora amabilis]
MFEELSSRIFRKRDHGKFARASSLFMSYLMDCRYCSKEVEEAFKEAFGCEQKMFNPLSTDTKIAVTATTAKDAMPCLFSNYNGSLQSKEAGYHMVRAQRHEDDISVNEAARCTTAAPQYFKTKFLKNLGTFQDGGLRHNNPLSIALWEKRCLWPEKDGLDFALSLRTGSSDRILPSNSVLKLCSPVRDGFLSRLFRSFMLSLDGEKAWRDLFNTLSDDLRYRFFRLNLKMLESEPDLDDTLKMGALKAMAREHITSNSQVQDILDSIYASMFYFELDCLPKFYNGVVQCSGFVCYRLRSTTKSRSRLYERLTQTSSQFIISGRAIPCVDFIPKSIPPFKKHLRFTTQSLDAQVSISISGLTTRPRSISGLPKSVKELIALQRLDVPFSQADHSRSERMLPEHPRKRSRENSV